MPRCAVRGRVVEFGMPSIPTRSSEPGFGDENEVNWGIACIRILHSKPQVCKLTCRDYGIPNPPCFQGAGYGVAGGTKTRRDLTRVNSLG